MSKEYLAKTQSLNNQKFVSLRDIYGVLLIARASSRTRLREIVIPKRTGRIFGLKNEGNLRSGRSLCRVILDGQHPKNRTGVADGVQESFDVVVRNVKASGNIRSVSRRKGSEQGINLAAFFPPGIDRRDRFFRLHKWVDGSVRCGHRLRTGVGIRGFTGKNAVKEEGQESEKKEIFHRCIE